MNRIATPVYMLIVASSACGSSGPTERSHNGPGLDAAVADAAPSGMADADDCAATACFVDPTYGDLGEVTGMAHDTFDSLAWFTQISDECGNPREVLLILSIHERGVFENGRATGTVILEGDETVADRCGACVQLIGKHGGDDAVCYFATGGTLVVDSIEGRLAGSLEDVTFGPVSCETKEPIDLECSSQVISVSFDEEIYFPDN